MSDTSIEWTDVVWNPVTGCTKVSEGCRHCYAEVMSRRFWAARGRDFNQVLCHENRLDNPLHWRKPRRVFVNSMSDPFHPDVPDEFIDRVFAVMALCPQHAFQVLTKRPERMRGYLAPGQFRDVAVADAIGFGRVADGLDYLRRSDVANHLLGRCIAGKKREGLPVWPLSNVWLGVSVEDQATADARIPLLLDTPAALRFVSCEPLLGPIRFPQQNPDGFWPPNAPQPERAWLRHKDWPDDFQYWTTGLDWVIVGGESGPKARPCYTAWIRSIVEQCRQAAVPCFVKQVGSRPIVVSPEPRWPGLLRNRKGADPSEWPEDLRVREMPA